MSGYESEISRIARKYEIPEDLFGQLAKQVVKLETPKVATAAPAVPSLPKLQTVSPEPVAPPVEPATPKLPEQPRVSLARQFLSGDLDLGSPTLKKNFKPKPVSVAGSPSPVPIVQDFRGKPSKNVSGIVGLAKQFLGTPYSWGGGGPGGPSRGFGRGAGTVGFDCSSFLQYVWAKQGVSIPRVTYDQFRAGRAVNSKQLKPGDAVFFRPGARGPEHVGMYIGNGQFIHAPKTGDVIKVSRLNDSYYRRNFMGARRYGG